MQLKKLFLLLCLSATMSVLSAQDDDMYDTYYYEYSEVLFGTAVDGEGNVEGESRTFDIGDDGAEFVVVIYNDAPFKTKEFLVEVYDEDNEVVETFTLDVNPDWDWLKFSMNLKEPGKYFIDIYNEVDTYVNSGEVTIVK
jgi:hypothetical protein